MYVDCPAHTISQSAGYIHSLTDACQTSDQVRRYTESRNSPVQDSWRSNIFANEPVPPTYFWLDADEVTMGLLGSGRGSGSRYFECRTCGTTVDEGTSICPACGSADIAEYELV